MNKDYKFLILTLTAIVLLAVGIWYFSSTDEGLGRYDEFAQCLADRGAIFYGAFWCLHCQNQKTMFGESAKLLPYVECSTPDGKEQFAICQKKGINLYPTWEFSDGSRETGELSFELLSKKTDCQPSEQL